MRKPVTFRLDVELLERARREASAANRSLTNFVETAVLRAIEQSGTSAGSAVAGGFGDNTGKGGIDL